MMTPKKEEQLPDYVIAFKTKRKQLGYTQTEIGEMINVSYMTISDLERNRGGCKVSTYFKGIYLMNRELELIQKQRLEEVCDILIGNNKITKLVDKRDKGLGILIMTEYKFFKITHTGESFKYEKRFETILSSDFEKCLEEQTKVINILKTLNSIYEY